jgi:Sulfatase-modifying factor enzyme 1
LTQAFPFHQNWDIRDYWDNGQKKPIGGGGSKNPVLIWEYSCRAGTVTKYWFGDKIIAEDANWGDSNTKNIVPVGSYKPKPFGLYDMHGNVREWCGYLRRIISQLRF